MFASHLSCIFHSQPGMQSLEELPLNACLQSAAGCKIFWHVPQGSSRCCAGLGNSIYTHWDESSEAPSKQRPPTASRAEPSLQVLALRNGSLVMPDSVMQKFPAGSPQYIELVKLKESIKNEVVMDGPLLLPHPHSELQIVPVQVVEPDWSIEGGLRPLDLEKVIAWRTSPLHLWI